MTITLPQSAPLHSNFVHSLTMAQPAHYKCSRSKVKVRGSKLRSQHNVMYEQQKRSKMATDRLSDLRTWHGDEIKADCGLQVSGFLKLQCIHNCHVFQLLMECQTSTIVEYQHQYYGCYQLLIAKSGFGIVLTSFTELLLQIMNFYFGFHACLPLLIYMCLVYLTLQSFGQFLSQNYKIFQSESTIIKQHLHFVVSVNIKPK